MGGWEIVEVRVSSFLLSLQKNSRIARSVDRPCGPAHQKVKSRLHRDPLIQRYTGHKSIYVSSPSAAVPSLPPAAGVAGRGQFLFPPPSGRPRSQPIGVLEVGGFFSSVKDADKTWDFGTLRKGG